MVKFAKAMYLASVVLSAVVILWSLVGIVMALVEVGSGPSVEYVTLFIVYSVVTAVWIVAEIIKNYGH